MKLTLHHINLCTTNVEAMDNFIRMLGLDRDRRVARAGEEKGAGDVAFVSDGPFRCILPPATLRRGFAPA